MKTSPASGLLIALLLLTAISACSSNGQLEPSSKRKAADSQAKLGVAYLQKNRLQLAKDHLEKALKRDRNSPVVQHYYALLQERLGNDAEAQKYFRAALQNDADNAELLNNYGTFLCKTGEVNQAESLFVRAANDPLYRTPELALENAGICLKKKGDYEKSASYFEQALAKRAQLPSALYHMAELFYLEKQNAKAQAYLYRYNELSPQTAETLLLCYKIHSSLGETAQADKCANQLLADFSQSPQAKELN